MPLSHPIPKDWGRKVGRGRTLPTPAIPVLESLWESQRWHWDAQEVASVLKVAHSGSPPSSSLPRHAEAQGEVALISMGQQLVGPCVGYRVFVLCGCLCCLVAYTPGHYPFLVHVENVFPWHGRPCPCLDGPVSPSPTPTLPVVFQLLLLISVTSCVLYHLWDFFTSPVCPGPGITLIL